MSRLCITVLRTEALKTHVLYRGSFIPNGCNGLQYCSTEDSFLTVLSTVIVDEDPRQ